MNAFNNFYIKFKVYVKMELLHENWICINNTWNLAVEILNTCKFNFSPSLEKSTDYLKYLKLVQ